MAHATYEVYIDIDGEGAFGNADGDVSAYCQYTEWFLGQAEPYDGMAQVPYARFGLTNRNHRFSPGHASALSGFDRGKQVRIRTTAQSTTRQMWIGWITEIAPSGGVGGVTEVSCEGFLGRLLEKEAVIPVQNEKTTNQVIEALLLASDTWPVGVQGFMLDYANLDIDAILSTESTLTFGVFDTGLTEYTKLFAFKNQDEERKTGISRAFRELMVAEWGYLWEDRTGQLVFKNRAWRWADQTTPVDATITENMVRKDGMDYTYGLYCVNDLVITFNPRVVATATTVLGKVDHPIKVAANGTAVVNVRYEDTGVGARVGGEHLVTPVANTDFTASAKKSGAGASLTSYISMALTEAATQAEVTITNTGTRAAWVQDLKVRGIKLTDFGHTEIHLQDLSSMAEKGHSPRSLDMALLEDTGFATDMAYGILGEWAEPRDELHSITVSANRDYSFLQTALGLTVGDRIAFSETQVGFDSEFYIVGEKHMVTRGRKHDIQWVLEEIPHQSAWLIGRTNFSEIGVTTFVGV